jgi:hypothetical protein
LGHCSRTGSAPEFTIRVAAGKGRTGGVEDIAGYRVGVFPHAVLVDAKGRMAAHGQLSTLVDKLGVGAMLPPRKP